jgi:hypothetical protein
MSWEDIIKERKHCSWCGNPKGWNGKDCITCNRDDNEEIVEAHTTEMSDEERRKLQ